MVVSGEADPFHLSAGSPSTGSNSLSQKGRSRADTRPSLSHPGTGSLTRSGQSARKKFKISCFTELARLLKV
jgi:hypothetical protein